MSIVKNNTLQEEVDALRSISETKGRIFTYTTSGVVGFFSGTAGFQAIIPYSTTSRTIDTQHSGDTVWIVNDTNSANIKYTCSRTGTYKIRLDMSSYWSLSTKGHISQFWLFVNNSGTQIASHRQHNFVFSPDQTLTDIACDAIYDFVEDDEVFVAFKSDDSVGINISSMNFSYSRIS